MKSSRGLFVVALALIVIGVGLFFVQPDGPESECVSKDGPTSGFVDEKKDCAISIESFNEIAEFNSKPKPFGIAGLVLVLAGLIVAIVAVVRIVRRPRSSGSGSTA